MLVTAADCNWYYSQAACSTLKEPVLLVNDHSCHGSGWYEAKWRPI